MTLFTSCLTETSNAHSLATLEPQQSRTSVTSTSSTHLNKALLPTLLISSSMVSASMDHNIDLDVQHDVSQTPSGSSIFLASINDTTHGILHQYPGIDFGEGMPKLAPNLPRHSGHSTVETSSLTNSDSLWLQLQLSQSLNTWLVWLECVNYKLSWSVNQNDSF